MLTHTSQLTTRLFVPFTPFVFFVLKITLPALVLMWRGHERVATALGPEPNQVLAVAC